jgi:hypothetical protein
VFIAIVPPLPVKLFVVRTVPGAAPVPMFTKPALVILDTV